MDEKLLQSAYAKLKEIEEEIKQIQEGVGELNQQVEQILAMKDSVKEFGTLEKQDEMLVPLCDGVFINVKLNDNKMLHVNVGSDTVLEKTPEQVMALLEDQENKIVTYRSLTLERLQTKIRELEQAKSAAAKLVKKFEGK